MYFSNKVMQLTAHHMPQCEIVMSIIRQEELHFPCNADKSLKSNIRDSLTLKVAQSNEEL